MPSTLLTSKLSTSVLARRHPLVSADAGEKLRVMADVATVKLAGTDTNDAYTLFEVASPPGNGPALLHTHPPQETFYVLEGHYAFYGLDEDGPYTVEGSSGSVVHIPAGAPHGFRNVGSTLGRLLIVYEPPGEMLAFFRAMHAAVDHPDPLHAPPLVWPSPEAAREVFARHGLAIVPPAQNRP